MAHRLLDTNIVSYIYKNHPFVSRYMPYLTGHTLHVSVMTVAELFEGAFRAGWAVRRFVRLQNLLGSYLHISLDTALARRWGMVRAARRRQPIGVADAWIAATALEYGLDLVTHNPADFQGLTGLTVISA